MTVKSPEKFNIKSLYNLKDSPLYISRLLLNTPNFFPYRNLTNLETGSFEFLDNFGKPEMKEADAESMTESEELSIIGEDLVDYIIGTSV